MTGAPQPILFVHHRPELGGAPQSLRHLIEELDPEEFEAHVFCPPGPAAELFQRAGARVHTGAVVGFTHIWASIYRGRRWMLFARELVLLPRHVFDLWRTLRRLRFGLVHINDAPPFVAAFLARRAGVSVVWHLRSSLPFDGADRRSKLIRATIGRLATATIAINEDIAAIYRLGSEVIPNSVDLSRFRPRDADSAKRELGLPIDRPVVTYFGFLYPSKGFQEFIEAARVIRDRGIEATFLIIGGAVRGETFFRTLRGQLLLRTGLVRNYDVEARRLVAERGLEGDIQFVPFTEDTARFYQASDIVVAPSRGPELGRPVIEGAACGVPVVASGSRAGAGIIVPEETGVLVAAWNADQLAAAVEDLLHDPERRARVGRAARAHAESRFNSKENARQIERIYRRILRPTTVPILYVHHRPQLGGAPASLAHLVENLSERFEPHVFAPEGPAAELFGRAGARVHTGSVSMFAHPWDNPYEGLRWLVLSREVTALPAHLLRLQQLIRRYRFPIVHLNDSPLIPAAWVAHRSGARVVWHLRSALAGEGRDRRSRAIGRLMERWGDVAIAIDTDVAARFRVRLPLVIVPNSVRSPDTAAGTGSAKRRLNLPEDKIAIGFAGFVRRQKGWQELVEAAHLLIGEGAPVHFVIMGGGVRPPAYFETISGRLLSLLNVVSDEESALKERVREMGLARHFSFLPFTADTSEIYSALDIVTFPNQGVGLGRPVLEAAAHGKPVIASGSPDGAAILVPDQTGVLLEHGSPLELAEALRRLIDDPDLRERYARAARVHAREHFDPERNARLVEDVYERLLGTRLDGVRVEPEEIPRLAARA